MKHLKKFFLKRFVPETVFIIALLLLFARFWLGDLSWYTTPARAELDAAVTRLNAWAPINDVATLRTICSRDVWVRDQGMSRVECKLGNYPITWRGHRINFTQINILYYENFRDQVPNVAIVSLDHDRRPHLVRYQVGLPAQSYY